MIPKEAIEKAIEGGWDCHIAEPEIRIYEKHSHWWVLFIGDGNYDNTLAIEQIALDPSFWQALGKALGWEETMTEYINAEQDGGIVQMEHTVEPWKHYARFFYDLILTGGDTDVFWQSLLTSKE